MKVTTLDTQVAEQIGHAFGYYDYGEEVCRIFPLWT